jgi:hypothetical protein
MSKKSRQNNASAQRFRQRGSLKLFGEFVEDFHPTFHLKFIRDETGHLIGAMQLWRHQHTGEMKWVECDCIDLPKAPEQNS